MMTANCEKDSDGKWHIIPRTISDKERELVTKYNLGQIIPTTDGGEVVCYHKWKWSWMVGATVKDSRWETLLREYIKDHIARYPNDNRERIPEGDNE